VGTITIDDHADPEFWTVDERQEPALYIHRMVIARAHAGHNLGAALLELANDLAARAGARWLRLDAWKTNTALHDYLQPPRLPAPRTVDLPHRGSGALFQRPVASAQP
jgi:GNAT superfamily N-acetyltransferase